MNWPVESLEARRLLSYTPVGPEIAVNSSDHPSQFDLAVAGDGSFIVVGSESNEKLNTIIVSRYTAAGDRVYSKIIGTETTGEISVSADAQGNAVVAYSAEHDSTAQGKELYFQTISTDGTLGAETLVAKEITKTAGAQVDDPQVAMDDARRFYVAWVQDFTQSSAEIHVGFYNAAGTLQGSQFVAQELASPSSDLHSLDLAATHDGSHAVWTVARDISDDLETPIDTGRVSASGPLGDMQQVVDLGGPARSSHTPVTRALINDSGGSFIAYDTETGSWVQRYDASNNPVGDPLNLGSADRPQLGRLPGGGFVAVVGGIATNYDAAGFVESDPQGVGGGLTTLAGTDAAGNLTLAYTRENGGPLFARTFAASAADVFAYLSGSKLFIDGTSANDNIDITRQAGKVVVERGTKTASFDSASVTALSIHAFGGDDTIINETELPTTIDGGDGNDQIFGGTGADRIYGGAGDDEIWGDDGPDSIWGLDGRDSIYGNGGNDRIEGGAQPDHIRGNGGRDRLYGNGGNDQIFGGASGDFIYGGDGTDQLWGEGGDDHLYGDDGYSDILHGGAGNDTFVTLDNVADQIFGDGGRDSATSGNVDSIDGLTSIEVLS